MIDRETEDRIVELETRIEALESMIEKLSDNVIKLDSILDDIADHLLPDHESDK